jgi:hypothetical protein
MIILETERLLFRRQATENLDLCDSDEERGSFGCEERFFRMTEQARSR